METYTDRTWFTAKEHGETADKYLTGLTTEMRRHQGTLLDNTKKCIAIFQWGGDARNADEQDDPVLEETCNAYNAAKNVIETVHAKVCKSRILPMPLTNGGGYLERQRAKEIGRALEGEFDRNEVDQIKEDVVLDALSTAHGAGAAKVMQRGSRVCIEHVPIEDVWFDPAEVRYRKPSCCYHVMGVDKFKLLAEYGKDDPDLEGSAEERRIAILRASRGVTAKQSLAGVHGPVQIEVVEAWHKPSGECEYEVSEDGSRKALHDGRHVIAIEGCTLVDEPWDGKRFPIAFYVPRKRRRSVWGMSMMFDLVAPQREYEKLTAKIQTQHQKMGVSGWSAPKGANVNAREIKAGTFVAGWLMEHDGPQGPTPLVVEPVAQGTYAYKDSIPRDMMQSQGVSSLSANSQLPAGLQQASGKALQVFEDFESERLLGYHRELERWIIALSWLVIDVARALVADEKDYEVAYRLPKGAGRGHVRWSKVLPKADEELDLRVFPISQLSKQPAALFAQLQDLLNSGAITVEQFKRLFALPDLEAENELDTADTDIIDRMMDIMITTGRYMGPDSFDNFDLLIARAGKMVNLCRVQDVPEDRIKLLHDFIEDAKSLKDQAAAKAAAAAPPPGAAPGPMNAPPPGAPPPPMPGPGGPMPMAA